MKRIKDKIGYYKLKPTCWAASNGDCNGPLTKEHVISRSICELMPNITIGDGLGGERRFGKGSYVLKLLCKSHNNRLSEYDAEALKLFKGLNCLLTGSEYSEIDVISKCERRLHIDKWKVERWYAKSFYNSVIFNAVVFKPEKPPFFPSSHSIVKKLFNGESFDAPFGLYMIKKDNLLNKGEIAWGFKTYKGDGYIRKKNGDESIWYEIPRFFLSRLAGIEIAGFFNITGLTDEESLRGVLNPGLKMLSEIGKYDFSGFGFDYKNETGKTEYTAQIVFK